MKSLLSKLFDRNDLTQDEAFEAMDIMMSGDTSSEHMAAFLGALRGKGESTDELIGFARSLREHARPIEAIDRTLIDTCGTGGDGSQTYNISTTCAFIIAAADLGVVKHGNRAQSSKCGSADVLEALNIPIDLPPEKVKESVEKTGFGFLFAPLFHPAMKHVAGVRKQLGLRTAFNLLGPIVNPAKTKRQVMGVYDGRLLEQIAEVLKALGTIEAILVSGLDGMDEISLVAPSQIVHLKAGAIQSLTIRPEDFGIKRCEICDLKGGDAIQNAQILTDILSGKDKGPKRDIALINSAAALVVGGKVKGLSDGVSLARQLIDSGKALHVLESARNA